MRSLSNMMNEQQSQNYFDEDFFYPRIDKRQEALDRAREEAAKIIQDAEAQAVSYIEKYKEEGIKQGLAEVAPVAGILQSFIEELAVYKRDTGKVLEPIVVDLVIKVAQKVIKDEIKTNPEIIRKNVAHALGAIVDKEELTVCVHPRDMKVMELFKKDIVKQFREIKRCIVEADDTVHQGGCYIKTKRGELDATIETQFDRIAEDYNGTERFEA